MNKEPMFPSSVWNSEEVYLQNGIIPLCPMTAKELDTDEKQEEAFNNSNNYVEEKFDGTRALLYFFSQECIESGEVDYDSWCRVFSRRISKKTGFYVENTDSVPHIRDTKPNSNMDGTILDGEMFIPSQGFQVSSAVMNCKYDKAIQRQEELGFQVFHAFDILFYKGIDLRDKPLHLRKVYLRIAIAEINSPYIICVDYFTCRGAESKQYYLDIVSRGGEGVIIKPKNGLYHHKRGWEYSKIKSFLTREMILVGFTEPTKEYTGKAPKDWEYYEDGEPVTRYYYFNQVGNMKLGVLISDTELESIPKNKRGEVLKPSNCDLCVDDEDWNVMIVCECGGYSDEEREYFTEHLTEILGSTIEVKANGIRKDSGRLRHPRFLRFREDKAPESCIWKDHIGG